jgi:hypothetical protein
VLQEHAAFSFRDRANRKRRSGDYRTADFRTFPAENFGTFAAGILRLSPVRGFRPILALRLEIVKVPKLTSDTRCPFFREEVTAPVKA